MEIKTYFTMEELIYSATALRGGLRNRTTREAEENLLMLRAHVLDPTREAMGQPIQVTSGFRTSALNTLIGGALKSQHMKGEAADISILGSTLTAVKNREMFRYIRDHLTFDQLILENGGSWVHVSYVWRDPTKNRGQVLEITHGKTLWSGNAAQHRERERKEANNA